MYDKFLLNNYDQLQTKDIAVILRILTIHVVEFIFAF